MNIPIPPQVAADMAAAARRSTLNEREERKNAILFAIVAAMAAGMVYLVW
jgi:hypothetical protein